MNTICLMMICALLWGCAHHHFDDFKIERPPRDDSFSRVLERGSGDNLEWRRLQCDTSSLNLNDRSNEALERAMRYFGPTTNRWAQIILTTLVKPLENVRESSFYNGQTNSTAHEYRLVYLPAWSSPLILKFQKNDLGAILTIYGWPDGKLRSDPFVAQMKCTKADWLRFVRKIDDCRFWAMESFGEKPEMLDSRYLLLEGLQNGRYHIVHREGGIDEPFDQLVRHLLKMAPVERTLYFWRLNQATRNKLAPGSN